MVDHRAVGTAMGTISMNIWNMRLPKKKETKKRQSWLVASIETGRTTRSLVDPNSGKFLIFS